MQAGHDNDRSYLYRYDRLNRLIFAESGEFTFDGDGQPDGFVDSGDAKPTAHTWSMDLLGNWSRPVNDYGYHTFQDDNGDGEFDLAEDVTLSGQLHNTNAANEIVSVVTKDEPASTPFVYDAAGNLIDNGVRTFKYDAWNRVVEVKASADLIAEYEYDALGRRIRKRVENSGAPLDTTGYGDYFYYDGHRMLEHHKTNASDTAVEPHRRYVYGLDYIDEVVAYYDTGAADPNPHFVLQDANYDVVAVTDHQGYLEQQYAYAPYGAYQHIEDGSGNAEGNGPADLTALLIPLGRNGLILDRETGLYYNRARYYDPLLSRFLQADPKGTGMVLVAADSLMRDAGKLRVDIEVAVLAQYRHGMHLFGYVDNNPARATDPSGLEKEHPCQRVGEQIGPWDEEYIAHAILSEPDDVVNGSGAFLGMVWAMNAYERAMWVRPFRGIYKCEVEGLCFRTYGTRGWRTRLTESKPRENSEHGAPARGIMVDFSVGFGNIPSRLPHMGPVAGKLLDDFVGSLSPKAVVWGDWETDERNSAPCPLDSDIGRVFVKSGPPSGFYEASNVDCEPNYLAAYILELH